MEKIIENGTVMRVAAVRNTAGGKGLNVARNVKLCDEKVHATGLVGGYNGKYLESLLKKDEITYEFEHIKGETRSCINILDPKYRSTEYLEPGCEVSEEEEESFLTHFPEIIKDSDVVTLSGSVPKGISKEIYRKLVELAKESGKQVILDTSGELLEHGMEGRPSMVKPNQDELELLFHTKIESREQVISYAKEIHAKGIPYVVISLGGEGALLVCDKGVFQGIPPKVEVENTVGCGDSMVAAFAVAFSRKYEPKEALAYAVSVATANAMSPNTGDFDPAVSEELKKKVQMIEL